MHYSFFHDVVMANDKTIDWISLGLGIIFLYFMLRLEFDRRK